MVKLKRVTLVTILSLLLLSMLYAIVCGISEKLALISIGVEILSPIREVVSMDVVDGNAVRILQCETEDDNIVIVRMVKNEVFFWQITDMSKAEKNGYAQISWDKDAGTQRFSATDIPKFYREYHCVYSGANAVRRIEIPVDAVPKNMTVNIEQANNVYVIHVLYFAEKETPVTFDVMDYIRQQGMIA